VFHLQSINKERLRHSRYFPRSFLPHAAISFLLFLLFDARARCSEYFDESYDTQAAVLVVVGPECNNLTHFTQAGHVIPNGRKDLLAIAREN
jgi:hypothetical protein